MSEAERRSSILGEPGNAITWPLGVGLGAAMGYFLDPDNGKRRRRLIQDKAVHFRRLGTAGARKAVADAENRLRGAMAEVRTRIAEGEEEHEASDDILLQRVRSRLGHVVSHPRAIEVKINRGCVILSGPTLESEADGLIREVRTIPGVHEVVDTLERFESAADVPSLQGGRERRLHRFVGNEWTPAYRMFGVAASLPLLGYGLRQRGTSGGVVAGLGASLLVRCITNLPLSKLMGWGEDSDVLELRKHVHVGASPQEVFQHLSNPEEIQRLLTQVESVTRSADGKTWNIVAHGLGGLPVHAEVEITDVAPNQHVSWRSVGGRIPMEGRLHLSESNGGTDLDLELHYNPPGGVLGEALSHLLGAGVRHGLSEDIPRIQRYLAKGEGRPASQESASSLGSGGIAQERTGSQPGETSGSEGGTPSRHLSPSQLKTGGNPWEAPESGDHL